MKKLLFLSVAVILLNFWGMAQKQDPCGDITTFPWVEAFSGTTFPPLCWERYTPIGAVQWARGYNGFSPPYSANVWSYDPGLRETWLVTPMIISPAGTALKLEFKSKVDFTTYYIHGSAEVWVSTQSNNPASGTFVKLKTLVNGVDFGSVADWRTISVALEQYAGENIYIGFRYTSNNEADHFSWAIDDVSVKEVLNVDAAANRVYGSLSPMVGEPFIYKAVIENMGVLPLVNYTVKLIDENNNVLAMGNNTPVLAFGEKALIDFNWSPTTAGNLTLYALIETAGDALPENNKSQPLQIVKQPANEEFEGKIGGDNTANYGSPFAFLFKYSMAQTLYFNHEIIDRGGAITKITYFNHFYSSYSHPIRIWMANTNLTTLEEWAPESEFTLVFEGLVEFPEGDHAITIVLDQPFTYLGDNLIIMSRPVGGIANLPGASSFYMSTTPDFASRCRYYAGNYNDFDWMYADIMPGVALSQHANIIMTIVDATLGAISGKVTSNGSTPVEGATVEIVGTSFKRTTDANGNYSFGYLEPGTYQLKASKLGHVTATSNAVTVTANETTVVNFTLTPNPIGTVTGKITSHNSPGGLANVTITLKGYQTHTTTSDASGNYSLPNVYGNNAYAITAALPSYQTYTASIAVAGGTNTHNIFMEEIFYPVIDVVAEEVGEDAVITWNAPDSEGITTYRYDSGINEGEAGWPNGNKNSISGVAYRDVKTELQNISWFATHAQAQPAYDLWIMGFDAAGNPDRNNIIYKAENVTNIPEQWCTYTFPQPLYISNGFFMGVSPTFGGFTSIGIDKPDDEYPFIYNVNLSSYGPNDPWTCLSADYIFANLMIRAEGVSFGKGVQFGYKGFANYIIYRLLEGQQSNETSWTTLAPNLSATTYTDTDWEGLPSGIYRYAVKAAYTGGGLSVPKFSNPMGKDMIVSYTVHLTTNSGDPVTGAKLVLTNSDGDPSHVYSTQVNSGTVTFPSFWKGTYTISVTLNGFHPYSASNIEVYGNGLSYSVELEEIIIKPFLLEIQETGTADERLLLWDNPFSTTYIIDDGTAESGFALNAYWDMGLGNKFEVGETGLITGAGVYGMDDPLTIVYGTKPVTLDIYNEKYQLVGKSEFFYLPKNDWIQVPLNNIPYSGIFYAMVHWYPEGTERTNFLGVDYDGPNVYKDFDMLLDGDDWHIAHVALEKNPLVFVIRVNAESTGSCKSVLYDQTTTKISGVVNRTLANALYTVENPVTIDTETQYELQNLSKSKVGYNVYLNNEEKATNIPENEFLFTGLKKGVYTAGVRSVYTSGLSEMATVEFEVKEEGIEDLNNMNKIVLYPNPFTNEIHINHPELVKTIRITDVLGSTINHIRTNPTTIWTEALTNGVYFVEIELFSGEKVIYKMVKK